MAYSLARVYPRGWKWFYLLAGLCAMNRIDGGAHFASDVCCGVALGYLIARLLPSADRMANWPVISRNRRTMHSADPPFSRAA